MDYEPCFNTIRILLWKFFSYDERDFWIKKMATHNTVLKQFSEDTTQRILKQDKAESQIIEY